MITLFPSGWTGFGGSANLAERIAWENDLSQPQPVRASLFVTCIIDQLYPEVGVSVVRTLRRCGVDVDFPEGQSCCGQPLYNSGFTQEARKLAMRTLDALDGSEYVVVPSGSCGAMLRVFYEDLFADDPAMLERAEALRDRVYEFTEFLTHVLGIESAPVEQPTAERKVAYHPSCHLLREMRVTNGPQTLLSNAAGVDLVDLPDAEQCCGFGGTFAIKYPHISEEMLADKVESIERSGADTITACDMGCLMHIGGAISRRELPISVRHVAQILDDVGD
ncbi:MAG: (Fe-S)-binding protein [Chloroflexi bacterium]|nr:(Fe-S)-binding protein [Chloroflexota bacterium]